MEKERDNNVMRTRKLQKQVEKSFDEDIPTSAEEEMEEELMRQDDQDKKKIEKGEERITHKIAKGLEKAKKRSGAGRSNV